MQWSSSMEPIRLFTLWSTQLTQSILLLLIMAIEKTQSTVEAKDIEV